MSTSSGSFFSSIFDFLAQLFSGSPQPPAPPPLPPETVGDLVMLSPRVLAIVFDPTVDPANGTHLIAYKNWSNVDQLIAGYIADIKECSSGLVNFQVVDKIVVDAFPKKQDGFTYTAQNYLDVLAGRAPAHDPDLVDYWAIVNQFDLVSRVMNNAIDEVWWFGGPYFGFYESRMVGKGAFWTNSPALENSDACTRRFIIMGYNYEREVAEMIHDLGHRAESIMTQVFRQTQGDANLYARFARYDLVAPGQAEVGVVHFPPNAQKDYDWGNPRQVVSKCDDWLNFPNFQGTSRMVTCADWGNGDERLHHLWWFKRMPHIAGASNNIAYNWWKYIADPNNVS